MLRLKLQYSGHLMWRANSLEKTLMRGKIDGRVRRGWQRMRWLAGWHPRLNGYEFEQTPGDAWRTGKPGKLQSMGSQSQTRLRDWTTTGSRTGCGALWLTFLSVSRPGRWLMPPNNYCWGVTEHWVWPSGNYAGELGFYFYFASKFLVDLQQLP